MLLDFWSFLTCLLTLYFLGTLLELEGKKVKSRKAVLRDIKKSKEEEVAWVTDALSSQYEKEMNLLEEFLQDNQVHSKKNFLLEVQIA